MLCFRDIDAESESDVQALVDWANDLTIRHLFLRFNDKAASERRLSLQTARDRLRAGLFRGRKLHLIELDGVVVGEVSLDFPSLSLHAPAPDAAWLGLVLGDERARGRGLGREAMLHIEALAKGLGASQTQIGVFEFNQRARRLYSSLGYSEIARLPDFTWWKGRTWTDIRMSKSL